MYPSPSLPLLNYAGFLADHARIETKRNYRLTYAPGSECLDFASKREIGDAGRRSPTQRQCLHAWIRERLRGLYQHRWADSPTPVDQFNGTVL